MVSVYAIGNCSRNWKLCLRESYEVKKACLLLLDMSMRETAFVMLLDFIIFPLRMMESSWQSGPCAVLTIKEEDYLVQYSLKWVIGALNFFFC